MKLNRHIHNLKRIFVPALLILAGGLIISSCAGFKRVTYVNPDEKGLYDSLYQKSKGEYKLQTGDILYIRIITPDEESDRLFNPSSRGSGNMGGQSGGGPHIFGYSVSDSGFIDMPVIGDVHVAGLTLDETKARVKNHADQYLKKYELIVKLYTFRYSMLGEVGGPGQYTAQQEQLNILEAIAMAGGLTYSANFNEVVVLRHTDQGVKTHIIDLTDDDLLASEAYYVMPNDIIYARPLKITAFNTRTRDYLTVLTTITSTLTAIFLIVNLGNR